MGEHSFLQKLICVLLIISILFITVANADTLPVLTLSDPNEQIITETVIEENILKESQLNEFITEENYLQEIIDAEKLIAECLIEESSINEVILCRTIYVPQENITEFSNNSQTSQLFGGEINLQSLFSKIAVGTGIIITIVILKKVGLPDPVATIVVSAEKKVLKFAGEGAAIGALFGLANGAADEINQSGSTSAVMGFVLATVGLILTAVSFIGALPSGGTTAITATTGINLAITGVALLRSMVSFAKAGYDVVKTFTENDSFDIDWDSIDWERVGVSSAEQAISYGAEGFMWGSVAGLLYGGLEGYIKYQKFNTPYTKYEERLTQVPQENRGHWTGKRGESDFVLDKPIEVLKPDGTKLTIDRITYKNAVPDFSPYQEAQVKIPSMTNNRTANFSQADEALAEIWDKSNHLDRTWKARDVSNYRSENHLTWHEMSNMESMQLVPTDVNQTFTHFGGVAEYNAMLNQNGGFVFD